MTKTIKPELLDELLSGLSSPDELLGDAGLFRQLKKALMERALGAELTEGGEVLAESENDLKPAVSRTS